MIYVYRYSIPTETSFLFENLSLYGVYNSNGRENDYDIEYIVTCT